MTDRELLEAAAKAAGIGALVWGGVFNVGDDLVDCSDIPYIRSGQPDEGDVYWNPLTDDGDALRLAVKLGLGLGIDMQNEIVTVYAANPEDQYFEEDAHDVDPYAATRRAIVRAAAEIGRG